MAETLRVNEIYKSIQGESSRAGMACVLVRLAGCNLHCKWCDTPYAHDEGDGEDMTLDEVMAKVASLNCPRVELTGGEPLIQPNASVLLQRFLDAGYETLLETNGSLDLSVVPSRVRRVMDVKCPSSRHHGDNRLENLSYLIDTDECKFVIADRKDYDYAGNIVSEHNLTAHCRVIFSPVWQQLTAAQLAKWILEDHLDVRLGLQLHKIIWPDRLRGT